MGCQEQNIDLCNFPPTVEQPQEDVNKFAFDSPCSPFPFLLGITK